MSKKRTCLTLLTLALAAVLALPALAATGDTQGFIYGKVTMTSGSTYEGRLRWNGDEEAFWGDFFNGGRADRPYLDDVPERDREEHRERGEIRIFGIRIGGGWDGEGRSFVTRFGDIVKLEVEDGNEAVLTMKDGNEVEIRGGSNDVGATIWLWDKEVGEVKLEWDKIDTIEFRLTPKDLDVDVFRLHGKVLTEDGDFEGFIQWDQEECLSSDELDGESRDGDMSIQMGNIKTIERRSRSSSTVVLRSGREFVLSGTNDVDDDNRGIYVDDPRFGRVLVNWDAFERLDFSEPGPSGPTYGDFAPGKPLRGKVTAKGGKTTSGRIVYDIDESETWDILNGEAGDLEYSIPFALIRSIVPERNDSSKVFLKGGEELVLEDTADVGEDNDGILVYPAEGEPVYVDWRDVERIDFE